MIGSLPITCPSNGCGLKTTYADISKHNEKCEKRTYECAYCDKKFEGRELFKEHVIKTHEHKFIQLFDSVIGAKATKLEIERIQQKALYI